jgi:hypothetical protein
LNILLNDLLFSFSNEFYNNINEEDMINIFKQTGEGFHIERSINDTISFRANLPDICLNKFFTDDMSKLPINSFVILVYLLL